MDASTFIRGLLNQPEPRRPRTYAPFGVLPLSEDDSGIHFDPNAGLLGSVIRGATLPGDVAAGKVDPMSEEGFGRVQDLAGLAAGGAVPFERPAGSLAAGASRTASPKHGISKLVLDRPVSEMTRDVSIAGQIKPRADLDPASLKGSTLIAGVGDRTAANEILHGYNGRKLAFDTTLEGGPDFSRANPDVWASAQSKITKLQNKANSVENPLLFYTAMGNRAGDFSHHITDAVLGDLPNQKITRANLKKLNGLLGDAVEGFPGLLSQNLREFMLTRPEARSNFVKRLDMGDAQILGAPNVGHARFATTNPDLIDTPLNYGGYSISRLRPGAATISAPDVPHTTYPVHLAGDYLGGLEQQIPPEIAFRDFVAQQRPETLKNPAKLGWLIEKIIPTQKVDQQWVDEVSEYLERKRSGL